MKGVIMNGFFPENNWKREMDMDLKIRKKGHTEQKWKSNNNWENYVK